MLYEIEIDDDVYEIEAQYFKGRQGKTNAPPEFCYPPEHPEVLIESIKVDGKETEVDVHTLEYIEESIIEEEDCKWI